MSIIGILFAFIFISSLPTIFVPSFPPSCANAVGLAEASLASLRQVICSEGRAAICFFQKAHCFQPATFILFFLPAPKNGKLRLISCLAVQSRFKALSYLSFFDKKYPVRQRGIMTTLCVNWSGCEVLATATYSPTVGIPGNSEAAHHYFVHFTWFLMTAQDQILAFSMTRQLHYIRTIHSIGRRINKQDPICCLSLCDFPIVRRPIQNPFHHRWTCENPDK